MIPMHRKFNDDIFARFLVIMKNVVISFIKEYRGPTLRPPCDAIDDVIMMKILFFDIIWDDLFISEVKLKLCLIFQNFQNGRHFELATNFFTGSYTGSWIYQKDSHEHFRHFELLIHAVLFLTYLVALNSMIYCHGAPPKIFTATWQSSVFRYNRGLVCQMQVSRTRTSN